MFLWHPGIVKLHDTVLYYLIAGVEKGGLLKVFCLNYGIERLGELTDLLASCPNNDPLQYSFPERYPFLQRVLSSATAIIVHSETSRRKILEAGYQKNVYAIDLLLYGARQIDVWQLKELKTKNGIAEDEVVVGCFGFIGFTKRLEVVVQALSKLKGVCKFKLLIVGQGDDGSVRKWTERSGLVESTVLTGFVDDDDFARYLASVDIVVNLRYPSMGEASATLIQALSYGRACVVTDHAWFSELPDDCVRKIEVGEREVDDLAQALQELCHNASERLALGERARAYVSSRCQPHTIARRYLEIFEKVGQERISEGERNSCGGGDWVSQYLFTRVKEIIPR